MPTTQISHGAVDIYSELFAFHLETFNKGDAKMRNPMFVVP